MRETSFAMRGKRSLIAGAVVVVTLGLAAPTFGSGANYLFYTAEPGESNRLKLTLGAETVLGPTWTWTDGGATIVAVPPMCVAPGRHMALCHPVEPDYLQNCRLPAGPTGGATFCPEGSVSLGDGDDRASIPPDTGFPWVIRGGPGNDELSGALLIYGDSGNDVLHGEPASNGTFGRSRLVGGPGRDVMLGGNGADRIDARDHERDRIVCGAGPDRVIGDWNDKIARGCERVYVTERPRKRSKR